MGCFVIHWYICSYGLIGEVCLNSEINAGTLSPTGDGHIKKGACKIESLYTGYDRYSPWEGGDVSVFGLTSNLHTPIFSSPP